MSHKHTFKTMTIYRDLKDSRIRELYEQGHNLSEIGRICAKEIGKLQPITGVAIRKRLKKMGIYDPLRKRTNTQLSNQERTKQRQQKKQQRIYSNDFDFFEKEGTGRTDVSNERLMQLYDETGGNICGTTRRINEELEKPVSYGTVRDRLICLGVHFSK